MTDSDYEAQEKALQEAEFVKELEHFFKSIIWEYEQECVRPSMCRIGDTKFQATIANLDNIKVTYCGELYINVYERSVKEGAKELGVDTSQPTMLVCTECYDVVMTDHRRVTFLCSLLCNDENHLHVAAHLLITSVSD